MIPPATATAPPVMWRSRISSAPKANRTSAVTTAVTTIRRPMARCVSASKCLVFSRNGTSAILGPIPISKSRRSFVTSSKSMTEKFNVNTLSSLLSLFDVRHSHATDTSTDFRSTRMRP